MPGPVTRTSSQRLRHLRSRHLGGGGEPHRPRSRLETTPPRPRPPHPWPRLRSDHASATALPPMAPPNSFAVSAKATRRRSLRIPRALIPSPFTFQAASRRSPVPSRALSPSPGSPDGGLLLAPRVAPLAVHDGAGARHFRREALGEREQNGGSGGGSGDVSVLPPPSRRAANVELTGSVAAVASAPREFARCGPAGVPAALSWRRFSQSCRLSPSGSCRQELGPAVRLQPQLRSASRCLL